MPLTYRKEILPHVAPLPQGSAVATEASNVSFLPSHVAEHGESSAGNGRLGLEGSHLTSRDHGQDLSLSQGRSFTSLSNIRKVLMWS